MTDEELLEQLKALEPDDLDALKAAMDDEADEDPKEEATETPAEEEAEDDAEPDKKKPADAKKSLGERLLDQFRAALGSKHADEDGTGFKVVGNHWLAVWSNDFKDRDDEVFTGKAQDEYVARVDMGLVPLPELWDSHIPGTRSGQAEFVAKHGHFMIALGTFDDTPKGHAAKAYYSKHAKEQGISHGFKFPTEQFDGKHYHAFNSFEISPLPRGAEANRFTSLEGIKAMAITDQKKDRLYKVFGKEQADQILADLNEKGKALEDLNVEFKEFTGSGASEDSKDAENELAAALKELFPELVGGQSEAIKASTEAVKRVSSLEKTVADLKAYIDAQKAQKPKRASEAKETELDPEDEDDAAIIKEISVENVNAKVAKAFPGFYKKGNPLKDAGLDSSGLNG